MNSNNKKIIRKRDAFIILAIVLTGIAAVCVSFAARKMNPGKTAVITVDSAVIQKINLEDHENEEFQIEKIENVVFEINTGRIRIKESDCPDKICVKTDYISSKGEKIVCLPKKLVVEIED